MTLSEYQKQAVKTAMFKKDVTVVYLTLGLISELGELIEAAVSYALKHSSDIQKEKKLLLKKELGDVMWYLAVWAEFFKQDLSKLENPEQKTVFAKTNFFQNNILPIASLQGLLADRVKKPIRDSYEETREGNFPENSLEKMKELHANVLDLVKISCEYFEIDFEDVLETNIQKLASRKERGKIKGSGDDR